MVTLSVLPIGLLKTGLSFFSHDLVIRSSILLFFNLHNVLQKN